MVVVLVVPIEEAAAEASGVLDAAEALGELRLVLEGLEVAFGERVVVGDMRPVVRAGDAEIGEQQGGGFGLHRAAAIGVQGELTGRHVVLRWRRRTAVETARRFQHQRHASPPRGD